MLEEDEAGEESQFNIKEMAKAPSLWFKQCVTTRHRTSCHVGEGQGMMAKAPARPASLGSRLKQRTWLSSPLRSSLSRTRPRPRPRPRPRRALAPFVAVVVGCVALRCGAVVGLLHLGDWPPTPTTRAIVCVRARARARCIHT